MSLWTTLSGNVVRPLGVSCTGSGVGLDDPDGYLQTQLFLWFHNSTNCWTAFQLLSNRFFCNPFIENHTVYGFKLLSFQFYCSETCGSLCRKWRICNFMTECENCYHSLFCLFSSCLAEQPAPAAAGSSLMSTLCLTLQHRLPIPTRKFFCGWLFKL